MATLSLYWHISALTALPSDLCEHDRLWNFQSALQPVRWKLEDPVLFSSPSARSSEPFLWCLDCRDPLPLDTREALLATLSPTEQQRCSAYRLQNDRELCFRTRAALRLLLAAWLGRPASAVILEIGIHGKPFCPGGPEFNVSHSGDLIMLALHPRYRVGVDVEQIHDGLRWKPIAERVLTKSQQETLERLPAESQSTAFLVAWCALEAELKAVGSGFSGVKQYQNSWLDPRQETRLRWELIMPMGYTGVTVTLPEPSSCQ
jgi:4'-phosphopantetheinyl transferase